MCCHDKIIYVILNDIMRILINASTSIGDSLYFAFMYDNIYRKYPDASMQVLCWHPMVSFYESFGFIEQVIPYDQVVKDDKFAIFLAFPRVDLAIDLQHAPDSGSILRKVQAKERIGVNPHQAALEDYTYYIVPRKGEHIKESFIRGFREYWPQWELETKLHIRINKKHEAEAVSLLLENNIMPDEAFVIIHPGAKGKEKLWPVEKWCEVVDFLHERGFKVVLIGSHLKGWGGAPILDEFFCNAIHSKRAKKCVNLVGKTKDFMTLSALIQKASVYCGLDTGPTHLAVCLGVPVVEIYKFINQETLTLWKPYGEMVSVIQHDDLEQVSEEQVIHVLEKQNLFQ